jgi:ribosomal protein S18 acetylase RimI-like enzyme
MTADHAALVAAGEVHVVEEERMRLGLVVLQSRADHLHVDILAVLPDARRRGIGRQMPRCA